MSEATNILDKSSMPSVERPLGPPLPAVGELSHIQSMQNVKAKTGTFPLEEKDIVVVAKAIEKLEEVKKADEAAAVEKQKQIALAEIARLKADRELLKEKMYQSLFGNVCIKIGPSYFLDSYNVLSKNAHANKGSFCNNPEAYIVDDFLPSMIAPFQEKFSKFATMITSKIIGRANTLISTVGSVVKQNNLSKVASNTATQAVKNQSKGITTSIYNNTIRTIILIFLSGLLAPVRMALIPVLPAANIVCNAVDVHKAILATLTAADKVYIDFCTVKSMAELKTVLGQKEAAAVAALKVKLQATKNILSKAPGAIKQGFIAAPGAIVSGSMSAAQGIRSGSISAAQGIRSGSISAAQGIRSGSVSAAQGIMSAASGFGSKFQETFKKMPWSKTRKINHTGGVKRNIPEISLRGNRRRKTRKYPKTRKVRK